MHGGHRLHQRSLRPHRRGRLSSDALLRLASRAGRLDIPTLCRRRSAGGRPHQHGTPPRADACGSALRRHYSAGGRPHQHGAPPRACACGSASRISTCGSGTSILRRLCSRGGRLRRRRHPPRAITCGPRAPRARKHGGRQRRVRRRYRPHERLQLGHRKADQWFEIHVRQQHARCATAADHDRRRVLPEAARRRCASPQASPSSAPFGPDPHARSGGLVHAPRLGASAHDANARRRCTPAAGACLRGWRHHPTAAGGQTAAAPLWRPLLRRRRLLARLGSRRVRRRARHRHQLEGASLLQHEPPVRRRARHLHRQHSGVRRCTAQGEPAPRHRLSAVSGFLLRGSPARR